MHKNISISTTNYVSSTSCDFTNGIFVLADDFPSNSNAIVLDALGSSPCAIVK